MGLARNTDFNLYFKTLQYAMEGFQMLSDPRKINVSADRIKVVSVPATNTFQGTLQRWSVYEKEDQERTAILNNMQLQDQVKSGMLLKAIEKGRRG